MNNKKEYIIIRKEFDRLFWEDFTNKYGRPVPSEGYWWIKTDNILGLLQYVKSYLEVYDHYRDENNQIIPERLQLNPFSDGELLK